MVIRIDFFLFQKLEETPLHIAARIKGGTEVADMLLKSGANVDVPQEVRYYSLPCLKGLELRLRLQKTSSSTPLCFFIERRDVTSYCYKKRQSCYG